MGRAVKPQRAQQFKALKNHRFTRQALPHAARAKERRDLDQLAAGEVNRLFFGVGANVTPQGIQLVVSTGDNLLHQGVKAAALGQHSFQGGAVFHDNGLFAKPGTYDDADPISVLDVDISSRLILDEILGIKDLRSDKRIDFVGGLRGLGELKRRVDSGEMKMALALHPVTMQQIMDIADSGKIMPPKATWFEPKLRSGLIIHKLD